MFEIILYTPAPLLYTHTHKNNNNNNNNNRRVTTDTKHTIH